MIFTSENKLLKRLANSYKGTNDNSLNIWWRNLSDYNKKYIADTFSFEVKSMDLQDISSVIKYIKEL